MPDHHGAGPGPCSPGRRLFLQRSSQLAFAAAVTVSPAGALINATEAWGWKSRALRPKP